MKLPKVFWHRSLKDEGIIIEDVKSFDKRSGDDKNGKIVLENQEYYKMPMISIANSADYSDYRNLEFLRDGPYRELPVDVPDSFVARRKTPPQYPPPKFEQETRVSNRSSHDSSATKCKERKKSTMDKPSSPVIPGLLLAAVPNNRTSLSCLEPTQEQLDVITKYQNALKKKKEEERRAAKEAEFLKRSLKGSRKLRVLEKEYIATPRSGIRNTAFSLDENSSYTTQNIDETDCEKQNEVPNHAILVASLHRLGQQMKEYGFDSKMLEPVQNLLQNSDFQRIFSMNNNIEKAWKSAAPLKPVTSDAKLLVSECLKDLHQHCCSAEAFKLISFLSRKEIEELFQAHDSIVQNYYPEVNPTFFWSSEKILPTPVYSSDSKIKIIQIMKTNEPLGATIRNDGDSVKIARIVKGGVADKCGLLQPEDEILEINGIEMKGKTVNEVSEILSSISDLLTIYINSDFKKPQYSNFGSDTQQTYIRALFDYVAADDVYLPCKELGISFQKGDILIITSLDDANWWQAYRYGEQDYSLAGLIPSKTFQQQREAFKRTLVSKRDEFKDGGKINALLPHIMRNLKKKQKLNAAYSMSEFCDEDNEEIPTYEEIIWYYPNVHRKRPVVLIGPPNIGRHELRQKLMENSDRFESAVPHTSRARKKWEVHGQDYYFITKSQFEADISNRKFVEYGQYEKSFYGTSLEAIRQVVNSGKICILNLHPQSLKILRNSDLMPFIVYIAPPSLEKLREKKIRNGELINEVELEEIIRKGNDIEDKYAAYFDLIIENNDIDQTYCDLLLATRKIEKEPHWIPASWIRKDIYRNKTDNCYLKSTA